MLIKKILLNRVACLLLAGFAATTINGAAGAATDDAAGATVASGAAYPGNIILRVDTTDIDRRIYRVQETMPVAAGALTLLYPQWLPGNHAPTGPIEQLAGLVIHGNEARIDWTRDSINPYAFRLDVPADVTSLKLEFQFISPIDVSQGRIVATPDILGLQWNTVVLYPAGYASNRIMFEPKIVLPHGWQFGSSLETNVRTGDSVSFQSIALDRLVDSPLFAGRHFRRFDLDPGARVPVHLDVVADAERLLDMTPQLLNAHRMLVQQADRLYGSRHFPHYDFLLALSDCFGGIGLEHHLSSENGTWRDYATDASLLDGRSLLPHEFTHSWNGKFRRPADLTTANFNMPMGDSLLWVYEGQTQYWGNVLTARSGLLTTEQARYALALTAASYDHRSGRAWRSLADTTNQPAMAYRRSVGWPNWQRTQDYYSEGQLIWLDADTKIRELSRDRHSLDDFARSFFGIDPGRVDPLVYTFADIVTGLNAVQSYDWATFLHDRVDGHPDKAPLDGLTRSGWRLAYADKPNAYQRDVAKRRKEDDFSYSLGITIAASNDRISEVLWDSPAFNAGINAAMTVIAVNGDAFDPETLERAITAAKATQTPIDLLVKNFDRYQTVRIDYHDGLRYPYLQRIDGTLDRLAQILAPRKL
ncbi:MAG: peptidase M61 [Dokdonella sp.]